MAALGTDPNLKVGLDKYKLTKKGATKLRAAIKKKKASRKAASS